MIFSLLIRYLCSSFMTVVQHLAKYPYLQRIGMYWIELRRCGAVVWCYCQRHMKWVERTDEISFYLFLYSFVFFASVMLSTPPPAALSLSLSPFCGYFISIKSEKKSPIRVCRWCSASVRENVLIRHRENHGNVDAKRFRSSKGELVQYQRRHIKC